VSTITLCEFGGDNLEVEEGSGRNKGY